MTEGPDAHLYGADRVLVDFDNTLTQDEVAWWNDEPEEPDEAVIAAINELYTQGKTIIVWTARPWSKSGKIAGRLTQWGLRYHGIRCERGSGDMYIDDKTLRPDELQMAVESVDDPE